MSTVQPLESTVEISKVAEIKGKLHTVLGSIHMIVIFVLKRLPYNILLLFLATFFSYSLAALTFNPLSNYVERNPPPSPQTIAHIREVLNLDGNIFTRYFSWLWGVLHGDFGLTIAQQPINEQLWARLEVSLRLVIPGTILGVALGLAVGYYAAIKQYKLFDYLSSIITFILISTPVIVLAPLLKWISVAINTFAGKTIFLYTGETSPTNNHSAINVFNISNVEDRLQHIVIPTTVLLLVFFGSYSRYMRGSMLDELGQDYIRTARAKGLRRNLAIAKHGFRTALIPLATLFAFSIGGVLTGAMFTERLFGWHGLGEWMIDGISTQDINITVTTILLSAIGITISRVLADVFTAVLDPRVRDK